MAQTADEYVVCLAPPAARPFNGAG